jgi:hypothetical protein
MTRPIDRTTLLSLLGNMRVYSASSGAGGPFGTVVWVDAQNLTVVPAIDGVAFDPRDFEFLGVLESYVASNDGDVYYSVNDYDANYIPATNRLTIAGANFLATSNFVVFFMDTTRKGFPVLWLIYNAIAGMVIDISRIVAENDALPPDNYGAEAMGRAYDTGSLPTVTDGRMTWLSLTRQGLTRAYDAIIDAASGTSGAVPASTTGFKSLWEAASGIVPAITAGWLGFPTMTLDRALRTSDMRMLLAFLGEDAAYHSPDDFTATQSGAGTLALTGLPFTPVSSQVMGVVEYKVDGSSVFHTMREGFTFAFVSTGAGTGTLTVAGTGVNFVATSEFVVVILGQQKALDAVLNAIQMAQLNARQQDLVTQQILFDDLVLDASPGDFSAWINTEGHTEIGLYAHYLSDDAADSDNDLYVRVIGNDTDTGTSEYPAYTGELDNTTPEIDTYDAPLHPPQIAVLLGAAEERWYWWRVKISTATRVRFQVWEEITAGGHGTFNMQCKLINR